MVFVPSPALSPRLLGLTSEAPRGVPSDALVAVLSHVLPGQVVQKLILVAVLVAAGTGAGRMVPGAGVGSVAAAVAAIWNPYAGERLLMGHWALLLGYAALPWVALGLGRRLGGGAWRALAVALVLGSLGGAPAVVLVGLVVLGALVVAVGSHERVAALRRLVGPVALLVLCCVPWAVPGLLRGGLSSDPVGFEVFVPRADTPLGVVVSVVTGGGIWNTEAVPAGRTALVPAVGAVAVVAVSLVGLLVGWRRQALDRAVATLAVAGVLGLLAVLLSVTPGVGSALAAFPGGGLLRDATRQSGPWALLLSVGLGLATREVGRRGIPVLAYAAPLLPVAVLPLLAWGVGNRLVPLTYPADVLAVRHTLDDQRAGGPGAVAVLPFAAYRAYPWNGQRSSLTPWTRLLADRTVTSSDLPVARPDGTVTVAGEDRLASATSRALASVDPAASLRDEGIRWLVVDVRDATPPPGAVLVSAGPHVRLYRLDGPVDVAAAARYDPAAMPVLVADGLALLLGTGMLIGSGRRTALGGSVHGSSRTR